LPVVPKANLLLFDKRVDGNLCILSARRKGQPKRRRGMFIHIALHKYYSKTCEEQAYQTGFASLSYMSFFNLKIRSIYC